MFSDNFNRTLAAGLGPAWHIDSGAWRDNDKANSDQRAPDQASVIGLSCADCKVEAKVVNFAATIAALDLRQTAAGDRYDVALLANGRLQIRRHNGGTVTVLADVPSGIADLGNWSTIALSATGAGPVALSAFVNGAARVSATDTSSAAITAPGTAGMWTDLSGVLFDDFIVTGVESAGGGADAGVDAGTPMQGFPMRARRTRALRTRAPLTQALPTQAVRAASFLPMTSIVPCAAISDRGGTSFPVAGETTRRRTPIGPLSIARPPPASPVPTAASMRTW